MTPPAQSQNEDALKEALLGTIPVRARLERLKLADAVKLMNIIQYALLFNFDLSCLLSDIPDARGNWRAKLYGRTLATALFECVDDMSMLLGRDLRKVVQAKTAEGATERADLVDLQRRFRLLRQRCEHHFRDLRHTTGAHRDLDASRQIDAIRSLDTKVLSRVGTDMMNWLSDLYELLCRLIGRPSQASA